MQNKVYFYIFILFYVCLTHPALGLLDLKLYLTPLSSSVGGGGGGGGSIIVTAGSPALSPKLVLK